MTPAYKRPHAYMNPYVAGVLLGLVLIATVFVTGRGLGASGAMKSVLVAGVETAAPQYAAADSFYSKYLGDTSPLKNWLVFEVLGVLIGGFLSALVSNRLAVKINKGPNLSSKKRLAFALTGGALFGLGAQFARGCTSGAALSGMAVLSAGGFLTMMAIFGGGYLFAFFFRRLWI